MLCGETRILYRWEFVECKDSPRELVISEFQTVPGTSTMDLMWIIKKPLCVTGNNVIMDSGFCVLKGLISMYERVVCGSSLVNNCMYWPTGIYGDQINYHFEKI